jgi:hypothetical protein
VQLDRIAALLRVLEDFHIRSSRSAWIPVQTFLVDPSIREVR